MKENKLYYNYKGYNCKRIIRALGDETLTAKQVLERLLSEKTKQGKPYSKQPTIGTVSQILAKYPIFEKVGLTNGGHSVPVNTYKHVGE